MYIYVYIICDHINCDMTRATKWDYLPKGWNKLYLSIFRAYSPTGPKWIKQFSPGESCSPSQFKNTKLFGR